MPKVFISYSHDSDGHRERVLALADRLRNEGIDCALDRYESFPSEGWPQWMRRQVRQADFVLVACTEIYARRIMGEEEPGRGLGAAWEGQLITQAIYENGGRNSKFIPIFFDATDAGHIPEFLLPATRFNLLDAAGYEGLYRLLTEQPAVLRPTLGMIRVMPPLVSSSEGALETETLVDECRPFIERSGSTVVWRLPRGFVLLEDLEPKLHAGWATVASYYDYRGEWVHSTHFHESYPWRERAGGIDAQCAKLGIPRGNWILAHAPIDLMMRLRHQSSSVSHNGQIEGPSLLDESVATVHPPGVVHLPRVPQRYRHLAASGRLRDLAAGADELVTRSMDPKETSERGLPDLHEDVRRLRREVRVDVHRMLSDNHPAVRNLEEIIVNYRPGAANRSPWLREFASAIHEAANCVEEQTA